jgi:hypothetical protein
LDYWWVIAALGECDLNHAESVRYHAALVGAMDAGGVAIFRLNRVKDGALLR